MKKFKILSCLLSLIMCIQMMQICVFAHGEFGTSNVMIDDMLYPISESASGNGWNYENCTLTLENYNGGSIYSNATYETKDDVTIVLKGDNVVNGMVDHKEYGKLIIKGDGTLKADSFSGRNIIIESGTVTVDSVFIQGATRNDYTSITVKKDAVLNYTENNSSHILSLIDLTVDGGEVNIHNSADSYYLHTTENVKISNGGKITVSTVKRLYCTTDSDFFDVYVITDKDGKTPTLTGDPNFSRQLSADDMPVTFVSICEKEKKPVEDIPEEKPAIEFIADGWATVELETAYNNDFLASSLIGTDLTEEITRAEFAETAVLVYEKITGEKTNAASSPFNDISHLSSHMKEMVEKSYALGFINGIDECSFAPDMLLTREQAATILYRIYEKLGKGYEVSANPFYDDEEISSWAKIPVYFMVNNGILQGMGDNLFMPKANAQKQQAVAIAVRIFENLR